MTSTITKNTEQAQYTAGLAVTGAWKATITQRPYEELGWESTNGSLCMIEDGIEDCVICFS